MKTKVKTRDISVFLACFLVVISNSRYLNISGIQTWFQYTGYGIFLSIIYGRLVKEKQIYEKKIEIRIFIVVFLLFCLGIIFQDLSISKKITLLLSMFILESFMVFGGRVIKRRDDLYTIAKAIIVAGIICVLLMVAAKTPYFIESSGDGLTGMTYGFMHKNYFAATCLVCIVVLYVYGELTAISKVNTWGFIGLALVMTSGSRGTCLMMLTFLFIANLDKFMNRMTRKTRMFFGFFMLVAVAAVGCVAYKIWASYSINYLYRLRGLTNYWKIYHKDTFHILFGNAEMAYRTGGSFVTNFRSVVGWDGTPEMAFLNILIKNGIIGLVGYVIIFTYIIRKREKQISIKKKCLFIAILACMIMSAFVESYLVNLRYVVSPLFFILLHTMTKANKLQGVQINAIRYNMQIW